MGKRQVNAPMRPPASRGRRNAPEECTTASAAPPCASLRLTTLAAVPDTEREHHRDLHYSDRGRATRPGRTHLALIRRPRASSTSSTSTSAGTGKGTRTVEGARWHPARGWPVAIGRTSPQSVPERERIAEPPDWPERPRPRRLNETSSWWTRSYVPDDVPHTAELWGPDTATQAAPVVPQLRDAREALARIEHPDAKAEAPIYATTIAQAVIDVAWRALTEGAEPPSRRDHSMAER